MVDKGGCKVGKKADKGGCKIGKKKEKPKPKKKLVVRNPGKPIIISKAPAKKPKTFDDYYRGKLNTYINDVIDLKKESTNRRIGVKRVKGAFAKLLKKNPNPTNAQVREYYDKLYPEKDYYLE